MSTPTFHLEITEPGLDDTEISIWEGEWPSHIPLPAIDDYIDIINAKVSYTNRQVKRKVT